MSKLTTYLSENHTIVDDRVIYMELTKEACNEAAKIYPDDKCKRILYANAFILGIFRTMDFLDLIHK